MHAHPLKESLISQGPQGTVELLSTSGNYGTSVMKMALMLVQTEGVISASDNQEGNFESVASELVKIIRGYSRLRET